ncbi:hypothetical protein A4F85_06835 [Delftia sp. GW456-R20]|nr:hypothetical protein A4F85_06835 [Delftia sp. GW456-R20]
MAFRALGICEWLIECEAGNLLLEQHIALYGREVLQMLFTQRVCELLKIDVRTYRNCWYVRNSVSLKHRSLFIEIPLLLLNRFLCFSMLILMFLAPSPGHSQCDTEFHFQTYSRI